MRFRSRTCCLLLFSLATISVGCSNSSEDASDPAYAASNPTQQGDPGDPPADPNTDNSGAPAGDRESDRGPKFTSVPNIPGDQGTPGTSPSPKPGELPQVNPTPKRLELKADLDAKKLVEFLVAADTDMQSILTGQSGITDPQRARTELQRLAKLKLEASRRLIDHIDATDKDRVEGQRGELQSLSHLAAMGDLPSAKELESLANANLESEDTDLANDSRLVLIGFASESLQNGKEQGANRIVELTSGFDKSSSSDVPALMALGKARQILVQYGYQDQARSVRDKIIELFANSSDKNVASMAAQIAGNVLYDEIENLLIAATEGKPVTAAQWKDAVKMLVAESPDLQTVQFLAGAALEFESEGDDELVTATFEVLSDSFDDPASATTREVELAVAARLARQQVVGRPFAPDLPGVGDTPPRMDDYLGKVILMPFWASGFPDSLSLIPQLRAIRDQSPDQVAILGMNLDVEGSPIKDFVESNGFDFDSFHSASSPTAKVANTVASQFGMVSMPFLVVLDTKGNVASIRFTGKNLEQDVAALLKANGGG